jgi:uncharacterized membrane protein
LEATIIHIPVLIGGALLGRRQGLYLGIAFGVISNIAAFIYFSPLFVYPWVAVLPRLIFGLIIYDVTRFFVKITKNKIVGVGISFMLLTLIHTLMVLTMMFTSYSMVLGTGNWAQDFIPYLTLLVVVNVPIASTIEMVAAAVVGAVIAVRIAEIRQPERFEYTEEETSNESSN